MASLDPRLNAFRADLADARLEGRASAPRYVEGRPMQVVEPIVSVRAAPRFDARQVTEALLGERALVFEMREGWAWAQLDTDGFVGYLSGDSLSASLDTPTHRIAVPASFLYPAPDLKSQPAALVTLNARLAIESGDETFARLAGGRFVFARHVRPLAEFERDYVGVAEQFLHVPYYWGGKSARGLDCSGLVQLALQACGVASPRDTDMQEALGVPLPTDDLFALRRGDLVFWQGHVGIMRDGRTLLHANGFHMLTVSEPLADAVARIGKPITSIRRLQ